MKTAVIFHFLIIILLTASLCYGQQADTLKKDICSERGHVTINIIGSTESCLPYVSDYADSTVIIYPPCREIEYQCLRCGKWIREKKGLRIIIWKK